MSQRLDELINLNLARSARAFDNARITYRTVRNGLVGLGFSAAIILPLASSDPDQLGPKAPPPRQPVVQSPPPVHNEYNIGVPTGGKTNVFSPNVNLGVNSYEIQFAPPMNRDWHRTTFSQDGDQFWALPDASFVMNFTRGEGFPTCEKRACEGSFSLVSERYVPTRDPSTPAWKVRGDRITPDDSLDCQQITKDMNTPVLQCEFIALERTQEVMEQTGGRPDLCLWMRRAVDPMESERGTVGIDVRWSRFDHHQRTCPRLY